MNRTLSIWRLACWMAADGFVVLSPFALWWARAGLWIACSAVWIAMAAAVQPAAAQARRDLRDPAAVTMAYLRAVYAREFAEAYRYVSTADQKARSLGQYLRQRGPLRGFALEAVKMLAADLEIQTRPTATGANQIHMEVSYRAPDLEKLSTLMRGWDSYQLNTLSLAERERTRQSIMQKKANGTLEMIHGVEKLDLIREGDEWRIFLDWAAGIKISMRIINPEPNIDLQLSRQHVATQPGELFDIVLSIKNRSGQPVIARIDHVIEPMEMADHLQFVQCGFLLPVRLEPGVAQEYPGTYLLSGRLPEGVREISLSYHLTSTQAN